MWQVDNKTPFSARGYFARDRNGFEHWVVAIRATFDALDNGLVAISETQAAVKLFPDYAGDDAEELLADADFVPFRPKVDLTVSGEITARDGLPFHALPFGVRVGSFEKQGVAFGIRQIRRGKRSTGWHFETKEETSTVPLSWRTALGGRDVFGGENVHPHNPIGKGWFASYDRAPQDANLELAQIEDPAHPFDLTRLPMPFGFGAVQPAWHPRIDHAGTYDAHWQTKRAPLLPLDFSEQFYQSAPADQVVDLRGGEPVTVSHLHPQGAYSFALPQIIFETTTRIGTAKQTHRPRLIGVHLEASKKRIGMVWNCAVPCQGADDQVQGSIVTVRQMAGVQR